MTRALPGACGDTLVACCAAYHAVAGTLSRRRREEGRGGSSAVFLLWGWEHGCHPHALLSCFFVLFRQSHRSRHAVSHPCRHQCCWAVSEFLGGCASLVASTSQKDYHHRRSSCLTWKGLRVCTRLVCDRTSQCSSPCYRSGFFSSKVMGAAQSTDSDGVRQTRHWCVLSGMLMRDPYGAERHVEQRSQAQGGANPRRMTLPTMI